MRLCFAASVGWPGSALLLAVSACVGPPLNITPDRLPDAVVDESYSESLDSDSSARDIAWAVVDGALPPGLDLGARSGRISGAPSRAGDFEFVIFVDDGALERRTREQAFRISVFDPIEVAAANPVLRVDEPAAYDPRIDGGLPPYEVTAVGLPAGLVLDGSDGSISGTPIAAVSSGRIDLVIIDSASPPQRVTERLTLTVLPRAVRITTLALDSARRNASYSDTIEVVDGDSPYSFSIIGGVLPAGLRLSQTTGVISGTPTTLGAQTFTVRVEDDDSPASTDEREFTIVVAESPVQITTATLPEATVGAPYMTTIASSGGTAPLTWVVVDGALPAGLFLDAATGAITGTPTHEGEFDVVIRVTDSAGPPTSANRSYEIRVEPM